MLHYLDPACPLEETLRALDDLVRAGKIRYLGCSNFAAWQVVKAVETSRQNQLHRFRVVEAHWSAATRELEREMLPMLRSEGLGLVVWGGLLGGLLSAKFLSDGASGRMASGIPATVDASAFQRTINAVTTIATRRGVPAAQVALAWLLHQREVTTVLFSARTAEQVEANVGAAALKLDEDEIAAIASAVPPTQDHGAASAGAAMRPRRSYAIHV